MPEITKHQPGNICWTELATTDQNAAKDFYSKLFGWQINDYPMGEGQTYTMLDLKGRNAGALYAMDEAQRKMGIPPHWNYYIAVDNADTMTAKAKSLGAQVLMEPFDVMDVGRMSIVTDPAGATFCLWQAKQHEGLGIVGEPGAFCWYELNVHDTDAAKKFYTSLFGWQAGGSPEYTEWKNGESMVGGMMQIQKDWGDVPPNWMGYVMVADVDASTAKAKELGGQVYVGPMDIPNMGRFSVIADPQGASLGLYQAAQR
jgi:uncharacterized protein